MTITKITIDKTTITKILTITNAITKKINQKNNNNNMKKSIIKKNNKTITLIPASIPMCQGFNPFFKESIMTEFSAAQRH